MISIRVIMIQRVENAVNGCAKCDENQRVIQHGQGQQ